MSAEDYGLHAVDSARTEGRLPLILIHGWNSSSDKWKSYEKYFEGQPQLTQKFKLYVFAYDWRRRIEENGAVLYQAIKNERWNSVYIVAHSMGGLVARSAIEKNTDLANSLELLITLGTPHHGSPMANLDWLKNDSGIHRADIAFTVADIGQVPILKAVTSPGGSNLGWDNSDKGMLPKIWNGQRLPLVYGSVDILAADKFTFNLNSKQPVGIGSKYIAIGSYLPVIPGSGDFENLWRYSRILKEVPANYAWGVDKEKDKNISDAVWGLINRGLWNGLETLKDAHTIRTMYYAAQSSRESSVYTESAELLVDHFKKQGISNPYSWMRERILNIVSSIILARFYQNNRQWIPNYVANDYVVPLQSALFADDGYIPGRLKDHQVSLSAVLEFPSSGYVVMKSNHSRVKQAIVFNNIFHSDLPDDAGIRAKVKELLLSHSPPPNKAPSPPTENKPDYVMPPANSESAFPILVLDRSGSIKQDAGVMNQVMNRAREVVNAVLKIDGKAAVVNFSGPNNSKLEARFTADKNELHRAINFPSIKAGKDGTALYDAVVQAVEDTKWHIGNKRVILFTDGKDHQSKKSIADVVRYCNAHNVAVVVVGFIGTEGRDDAGLQQLASGAQGFYVQSEFINIDQILSRARTHYKNAQDAKARGSAD